MAEDQSQFYYGWIYHKLLDPPLEEARKVAVDLIPEGSPVLDIGCGTGQLCVELRVYAGGGRESYLFGFRRKGAIRREVNEKFIVTGVNHILSTPGYAWLSWPRSFSGRPGLSSNSISFEQAFVVDLGADDLLSSQRTFRKMSINNIGRKSH